MNRRWYPRIVFTFMIAFATAVVSIGVISTLNSSTPKPAMNETILKCKVQHDNRCYAIAIEGYVYRLSLSKWALLDIPICGHE